MKRRKFLATATAAGLFGMLNGRFAAAGSFLSNGEDVVYNRLPLWRGFNLQEKFTHKPDEWLSITCSGMGI